MVDRKIDPFLFMRPDDKERMQMLIKHIKKEKEMFHENKKGDKVEKKNDVQSGRRWVDIEGLVEHTGYKKSAIRYWIGLKQIPYHQRKKGGLIRFDLDEIDKWMKEKEVDK